MFVSSYNTYVQTHATDKTSKSRDTKEPSSSNTFATKFLNKPELSKLQPKSTPIDYLQSTKVFNNKQKLQQNLDAQQGLQKANKFNFTSSLTNAKVAYAANATMFSIVAKPKQSLSQEQGLTKTELSSLTKKLSAINTYLSNDKYYQITA